MSQHIVLIPLSVKEKEIDLGEVIQFATMLRAGEQIEYWTEHLTARYWIPVDSLGYALIVKEL